MTFAAPFTDIILRGPLAYITKPALDSLSQCMAGASESLSPGSHFFTPISALIKQGSQLETATVFAVAENMACILLVKHIGVREACEKIMPVVGFRAKRHLEMALDWVEKKAESLPLGGEDSDTPAPADLHAISSVLNSSLLALSTVNRTCLSIFGQTHIASVARLGLNLAEQIVILSVRCYSSLFDYTTHKADSTNSNFVSAATFLKIVLGILLVAFFAVRVFFAFVPVYASIVTQSLDSSNPPEGTTVSDHSDDPKPTRHDEEVHNGSNLNCDLVVEKAAASVSSGSRFRPGFLLFDESNNEPKFQLSTLFDYQYSERHLKSIVYPTVEENSMPVCFTPPQSPLTPEYEEDILSNGGPKFEIETSHCEKFNEKSIQITAYIPEANSNEIFTQGTLASHPAKEERGPLTNSSGSIDNSSVSFMSEILGEVTTLCENALLPTPAASTTSAKDKLAHVPRCSPHIQNSDVQVKPSSFRLEPFALPFVPRFQRQLDAPYSDTKNSRTPNVEPTSISKPLPHLRPKFWAPPVIVQVSVSAPPPNRKRKNPRGRGKKPASKQALLPSATIQI